MDELNELLAAESEAEGVALPDVPTDELPSAEPERKTKNTSESNPTRKAVLAS